MEGRDGLTDYKNMIEKLNNGNRFCRLGRAFKTTLKKYFYDMGTGKVFEIEDNVYQILRSLSISNDFDKLLELPMSTNDLIDGLEIIRQAVKNENILLAPPLVTMEGPQVSQLKEKSSITSLITLEVTEQCNLRCRYCVYNDNGAFRTFGTKNMSFETAKKAINYLANHSGDEVYISFYGGEPLINFELIKQCVSYAKTALKNKKIRYSLTTNGTLLTPEIAKYFASIDDFVITVSLDGPENIHDEFRVFPNEKGSFKSTIQGLKNLVIATGDRVLQRVKINMVLEKPSQEKFDKIQDFISTSDWLPKGIMISTSYASHGEIKSESIEVDSEQELSMTNEMDYDPLSLWSKNRIKTENIPLSKNSLITKENINKELSVIHRRMLINEPVSSYFMNGCCTPGSRRIYVTVDGNFKLCEKMGPSPSIGNVESGINLEFVEKHYVTDFIREASKYCSQCWAVNLCPLCYMNCYDEDRVKFTYRHVHCMGNRILLEQSLVKYHEILDRNPEELNYLNDIHYK